MNLMRTPLLAIAPTLAAALIVASPLAALPVPGVPVPPLLELPELCTFASSGQNPYMVLLPGWTLELAGDDEEGAHITVDVIVLDETRVVDGVETRVVFEEEKEDRELVEQSWNWLAICQESGSVFYFGEAVDIYENGVVVAHDGAWEAGVDNARPGILMPGQPAVGHVHFQEIAPLVAMDMAVVLGTDDEVTVPAGTFPGSVHTLETTILEPGSLSEKWYAPGVGLLIDDPVELVRYGFLQH
ncbi:MAG TPA: hypothetical protein VGR28_03110 [Candidatus Thermoplasmatota archaeon]|nr:hypothetical protein [Candidatus Thermoplasmatota archaeon]